MSIPEFLSFQIFTSCRYLLGQITLRYMFVQKVRKKQRREYMNSKGKREGKKEEE